MMPLKRVKASEMVVRKDDFGFLVQEFIMVELRHPHEETWLDARLREWWPMLEEYYQRQIQSAIEVAILLDEPARSSREPLKYKEMWKKFIADFRPPKSPHTIKYHCDKCKAQNVKLWRGVHGCADNEGNKLLCATCLAPGEKVDDNGKLQEEPYKDASGKTIGEGMETDQVKGWLPAIPVGDTYWGYSSVPSQDVEWWVNLPTYPK